MQTLFTNRERHEIGAMLNAKENATGPICAPIGNWLVGMAKRTWPRFSAVAFWTKTNSKRSWVLASYHHPACLCWSWSIWISFFRKPYGKGLCRFWSSYGNQWRLSIPFVFEISWHSQDSDWMLSSAARRRLEAVALFALRREPEVQQKEAMQ